MDRAADFTLKDAEWPRTLADRAFVMLRDAIVTAEIKPGQRLRLDEIAERLGMSVMPAREALKRLEASGLIESEPHRGATVAPLAAHELSELFEIRLMIEVPAIRRAAEGFEESDTVAATDAPHPANAQASPRPRPRPAPVTRTRTPFIRLSPCAITLCSSQSHPDRQDDDQMPTIGSPPLGHSAWLVMWSPSGPAR